MNGGEESSQVVLEYSTTSNAVYQSHHRSCHIIKFSTNITKLTCFSVELNHSSVIMFTFSFIFVRALLSRYVRTHVILCAPLHQTDRHFIEVVFNACLDITVAGSSIRLQDNIDHLP